MRVRLLVLLAVGILISSNEAVSTTDDVHLFETDTVESVQSQKSAHGDRHLRRDISKSIADMEERVKPGSSEELAAKAVSRLAVQNRPKFKEKTQAAYTLEMDSGTNAYRHELAKKIVSTWKKNAEEIANKRKAAKEAEKIANKRKADEVADELANTSI